MSRLVHVAALAVLFGCAGHLAEAQENPDPGEAARFHFGPLRFTPGLAVSNIGIDNNVFNEVQDPKRDATTAIGPAVNLWMKMGPARFSSRASGQYLYFKNYENQRSWNNRLEGRLEVPRPRLTPFFTGSYANTRERPGFEIDSRARRRDDNVGLGIEARLSSKTAVVIGATRSRFAFDRSDAFLGESLATALNRTSDAAEIKLRYQVTPLTTFSVRAERTADRFVFDQLRNADSVKVISGFELKPVALIAGSAFVGVRRFNAVDASVPDYQGLVATVDATYTVAATRLGLKVNRDLVYSYEPTQPYYGLTAVEVQIVERVTHTWDLVARGGWQWLDYHQLASVANAGVRADRGRFYGAGVGYRLGETLRIGVDANYYQRTSPTVAERDYEGLRVGASFSYGLAQ